MTKEEIQFRPIPGFDGYRACSDGSIWSFWLRGRQRQNFVGEKWRKLKGSANKHGRLSYRLKRGTGAYFRKFGSHLVLGAFVGPRPDGLEACHNNGNCTDDSLKNLRWDTSKSNAQDKYLHGTMPIGERVHTSKLTANDVLEIRRIGYPLRQHVERFGISDVMVYKIIARQAWKHVV